MSATQGVAYRKGSVTKTYPRASPKGSVGALDTVRLSPTAKRRPYRRTFSLDIQLDEVARMGSKKPQTMAFEELLGVVLKHFESDSDTLPKDRTSPDAFFLVCKWYLPTEVLLNTLVDIFERGRVPGRIIGVGAMKKRSSSIGDIVEREVEEEEDGLVEEGVEVSKWAVVRGLHHWLQHFPEDFKMSEEVGGVLKAFQQSLESSGEEAMAELINLDDCPELPWLSTIPQTPSMPPNEHHPLSTKPSRKPSIAFENMIAEELAETLLAIDMKYFRRITFQEFHTYAVNVGPTEQTLHIKDCINWFNGLSLWTESSILRQRTNVVKRAKTLKKFIDVAKQLCELNSLNTALAVIGGLQHSSIKRLSATWAELPKGMAEELEDLTEIFSISCNFATYRQHIATARENGQFVLPVIGILMKDLCAVQMTSADYSKDPSLPHHVNLDKYDTLLNVFSLIKFCHKVYPPTKMDLDFMRILRAAVMHIQMTDDALMEISYNLEAKENSRESRIEVKPSNIMTFAEWASGHSSRTDPITIEKNVEKMVDAVFRMYTKEKSAAISIHEFQALQSNFPFIENFSVVDENNDGMISRDEMVQYFLRANQQLRAYFKHDFVEHTFLPPVTCEKCGGLLWGLVKQGVKCRDCGIICHKDCKNWVVVDCRKGRHEARRQKKNSRVPSLVQSTATLPGAQTDGPINEDEQFESVEQRLSRTEEARDALAAEVTDLKRENAELRAQVQALQQHVGHIRQHTIQFILDQMNTLSLQDDTEV